MHKFKEEGNIIKDVIHGGLDGIITTFAIVSGVVGASLGASVVLIIGCANLISHGLAIAISYYLGTEAENKYNEAERKNTQKKLLGHFEQTEKELERYYTKHHYTKKEAEQIVHTLAKHKQVLAQTVMDEDYHLENTRVSPFKTAIATFLSFVFFGFIPLFSYLLELSPLFFALDSFIVAASLTGATIFGLGTFKAAVTDKHWLRSGLEVLILGGIAASLAFLVGSTLSHFA